MKRSSVVVPSATATSSVAFHRSLGRRGIRTIAVSETEDDPAFRSRYCDECVVVPDPAEDITDYKDALLALAARPDVETIVPLREEDIYVLSKHRSAFGEHVATPWPTFETLRTAHDRDRLFAAAREAGVSVPETQPIDDVDDWNQELVVKSRFALLADEYVPERLDDEIVDGGSATFLEPDERPDVEALKSEFKHEPHVQKYLRGTEYSLGVLYEDGEPVVETQKRVIRGEHYYCGPSVYHESVDIPALEAVGRDLLTELDWHGPADVDIIRDEATGEYKLLEINPRFWATVQMEIHAGFDFPFYYWNLARDEPVQAIPTAQAGVTSHFLLGELSYLTSILTEDHPLCTRPSAPFEAWEIGKSVLRDRRSDLLTIDDPRPFVACLANEVRART